MNTIDPPPTAAPSRRQFLVGAAGAMLLPQLISLLPRRAWAAAEAQATMPSRRLALFHTPAGIVGDYFFPKSFATDFALTDTLAPLSDLKADVLVLSNMCNGAAKASPAKVGQGKHSLGMATLFTGANLPLDQPSPKAAASLDQIYAAHIAGQTPVRSLQLSRPIDSGDCDPNYVCAAIKSISWADAHTPLTPNSDPRQVFKLFFAGADSKLSAAAAAQLRLRNKSILDAVTRQATALQAKLSSADQQKLDQYLTGVRAVETRLFAVPNAACSAAPPPADIDPGNIVVSTAAMMDLMVLAFQCDLTRVISYSFGNGHNNTLYSFLPNMPDGQHGLSHIDNPKVRKPASAAVEAWQVGMMARFVRGIKAAVDESSASMLSSSVVAYSSELADGNLHNYDRLPLLLVGQGGGAVRTGRHLQMNPGGECVDIAQVWLGILQGFGVPAPTFGGFNVSEVLPGLSSL